MSAAGAVRDVRRGSAPGSIEFTLEDGVVLYATAYGWNAPEIERTQAALLAALGATGVRVMPA